MPKKTNALNHLPKGVKIEDIKMEKIGFNRYQAKIVYSNKKKTTKPKDLKKESVIFMLILIVIAMSIMLIFR